MVIIFTSLGAAATSKINMMDKKADVVSVSHVATILKSVADDDVIDI